MGNKYNNCIFTQTQRAPKKYFNWRRAIREPSEELVLFKSFFVKVTGILSCKINVFLKYSFDCSVGQKSADLKTQWKIEIINKKVAYLSLFV